MLYAGTILSSRETGVLAAIGAAQVPVFRRVRVAIISTGDEIIPPGSTMRPGLVYDSNAQILADSIRELGAEPLRFGIIRDDQKQLEQVVSGAQNKPISCCSRVGRAREQATCAIRLLSN